jgi:hypothetical protein
LQYYNQGQYYEPGQYYDPSQIMPVAYAGPTFTQPQPQYTQPIGPVYLHPYGITPTTYHPFPAASINMTDQEPFPPNYTVEPKTRRPTGPSYFGPQTHFTELPPLVHNAVPPPCQPPEQQTFKSSTVETKTDQIVTVNTPASNIVSPETPMKLLKLRDSPSSKGREVRR